MKFKDFRADIDGLLQTLQSNGKAFLAVSITAVVIMGIICLFVFSLVIKSPEEVMVPSVTGKELTAALLEMQAKELYPKIQLRYSNLPDEKGLILEQNPPAGAIVKAGRRINLVVSRGVIIDKVENYIGQKIDDVKVHLQTLFTSASKSLIVLQEPPLYINDPAEPGTILEQNPLPDTSITDPVKLELVVSKGPENEKVKVPALTGLSISDTLLLMQRSKIVVEFSARPAQGSEKEGTVVSQSEPAFTVVDEYSRMQAEIVLPAKQENNSIIGVFTASLPEYPYPLPVRLDVYLGEGESYQLIQFSHPGGLLTVPYAVPGNAVLVLYVLDKETKRISVQ